MFICVWAILPRSVQCSDRTWSFDMERCLAHVYATIEWAVGRMHHLTVRRDVLELESFQRRYPFPDVCIATEHGEALSQ